MKQVVFFFVVVFLLVVGSWFAVRGAEEANGVGSQVTLVCYISGTDSYNVYRGTLRSTQGSNYKLSVNGQNLSFAKRSCSLR